MLQGGTFWKALTVTFLDPQNPAQRLPVYDVQFKNVDRFLPIAVVVHTNGRDTTIYSGTQAERVRIANTWIDSLVIRTRNASHSAIIDDLSFEVDGQLYLVDFDSNSEGYAIAPNTQLPTYFADWIQIEFGADNAVPTIIRGGDLAEAIGRYISNFSGPLSTFLILVLISLPCWMVFRFAHIMNHDLSLDRFFTEQDHSIVQKKGMNVLWGGKFTPKGADYVFQENTELYKILDAVGSDTASDQNRLYEYCMDRIYALFDELEDRFSETFGMMGVLALSLGLLGTVVGMIDAFKILEDTMKVGEGPAQTQLKMAHYINFALVTTAIGFMGRILSMVLVHRIKAQALQNREQMIEMVGHFKINSEPGKQVPHPATAEHQTQGEMP